MREIEQEILVFEKEEIDGKEVLTDKVLFKGSCVIRMAPRVERSKIQMDGRKAAANIDKDLAPYTKYTDDLLNAHLLSIDVEHVPSKEKISKKEDLDFFATEGLIAYIVSVIAGGQQLGKKIAEQ